MNQPVPIPNVWQVRLLALLGFKWAALVYARIILVRSLQAATRYSGKPMDIARRLNSEGQISNGDFRLIRFAYGESCRGAHGKRLKPNRDRFPSIFRALSIVQQVSMKGAIQ